MHPQAVHYARQLQAVATRLQATEAEINRLREELARRDAQAKRQKVMHQYARELQRLQAQGVEVDVDEELKAAADDRMTAPQMQRQLHRIARHYGRSPVGGGLIDTNFPVMVGKQKEFTRDHIPLAHQRMNETGCTYAQAVEWVKANAI